MPAAGVATALAGSSYAAGPPEFDFARLTGTEFQRAVWRVAADPVRADLLATGAAGRPVAIAPPAVL